MPRRRSNQQTAPARQLSELSGLLLVAPSKRRKGTRELGKLLDKDAADIMAKQPDQPQPKG